MENPAELMENFARVGNQLRLLVSAIGNQKLRQKLIHLLADNDAATPLERLELLNDRTINLETINVWRSWIQTVQTAEHALALPKITLNGRPEPQRRSLSAQICREIFSRLALPTLNEKQLNAALAMLVDDPALCRRDAVEDGVLDRTADGSTYRLAQ